MGRFIVRRVIQMVFVLFAVSVITFLIFNVIPNGDPAVRMAGKNPTESQIAQIREDWGFNDGLVTQYLTTMKKVFTGDLQSYFTQLDVGEEIWKGLPRTLSLAIGAALLWFVVAVAFGLYSAMRAGKFADRFLTIIALIGISLPVFWIGALMNYYLGFKAGIFPNGGYVEFTESPIDWAYHLILPWTALAILFIGFYSRLLRSNVLDTINEDYVRTARAKGLSERQRDDPPRPAQLDDPDRHPLGPRLRRGDRRRRDPDRDGLRPPGRRPVHGRGDRAARRPAGAGGDDVQRLLHRAAERDRGHHVRLPRPADPAAVSGDGDAPLLSVRDLRVSFATEEGVVQAVDEVSFDLAPGEVLAVVGESGCGKSVTAMTLMGLTRSPNARFEGTATYRDTELIGASDDTLRRIRGEEIAMIFQDPMTSLNPVHRIGDQIVEQIQAHESISDAQARERVIELLERVGIPRARERVDSYPYEFSGGMRQRVMIALALSCDPSVLIADEPTTALDVTIQAQILERIRDLRDETGAAVILVTHDLGVVADIADRIAVMYAGRIVEQGTLDEIFYDPQHPYTWGLLGSITRVDRPRPERLPAIAGLPPSLADRPEGCHFRPRCPHEFAECAQGPAAAGARRGTARAPRPLLADAPSSKRELREVRPGEIGLATKAGAEAT